MPLTPGGSHRTTRYYIFYIPQGIGHPALLTPTGSPTTTRFCMAQDYPTGYGG